MQNVMPFISFLFYSFETKSNKYIFKKVASFLFQNVISFIFFDIHFLHITFLKRNQINISAKRLRLSFFKNLYHLFLFFIHFFTFYIIETKVATY